MAEKLQADIKEHEYSDAALRARVLRRYAEDFDPPGFAPWFQQWTSDLDGDSVLCVHAEDVRLSSLPWEEILLPTGNAAGRVSVVRVCQLNGESHPAAAASLRMLLAGWTNLTGYPLPGVIRELQEFPRKVDSRHLQLQMLADATRAQFLEACATDGIGVLHLSPPSLVLESGQLAVPTTGASPKRSSSRRPSATTSSRPIDAVPLDDVNEALSKNRHLRMVVVNACHAGLRGCEQIARSLKVVAIGWPAMVNDDVAADFTFYFYQRLLEGRSPLLAVRSFARTIGTARLPVDVPVLWLPSPEWVSWRPFAGADVAVESVKKVAAKKRTGTSKRAGGRKMTTPTPGHPPEEAVPAPAALVQDSPAIVSVPVSPAQQGLHLEFRPRQSINPALLVNGLHPIEHISIESPSEQQVHLCIECDTGSNISTFRQTVQLKKGAVPVNTTDIHFPSLHELIDREAGRRRVSFTATLTSPDGTTISGQTRTALWMGAKEWLDQEDTWAFIPAFVNPFDEGVLKVFDYAKKVLRTLGHPNDTFNGYQSPEPEYVSTQMKAIFQTLRDDSIGITYISPPGSPVFDSVSKRPAGQIVRTHTEVVEHKLGTCHDLALLIAACAEYVGIHPVIVLIDGHTFVGYWLTDKAQQEYWGKREGRIRTSKFGEGWTMTDADELVKLVAQGDIALVEATYVCERNKTFDEACTYRKTTFALEERDKLDVVIDVFAARGEVQPL
ncbi:MAG: CHAT domain-containing protein [Gemmatimonadaceae bacterium]|nr:CHAT domain-containing protein [Gemmatimonadaceae bacterium]